jgi:hypothetical protein|tara:strand:- start:1085 stop:1531 length:447 start_codon:yes stop_codon:yes gene_type:complete
MAKLKIRTTLLSSDLLGIPLELHTEVKLTGNGVGKSFAKFTTTTTAVPPAPEALPASVFSSTGQRVLIYIRNTSASDTEYVTLWVKNTITAATLDATACSGCADYVQYIPFAQIPAGGLTVLPFASHDTLYVDAAAGTPEIEYLIMEE